jgi:hypothetical protein
MPKTSSPHTVLKGRDFSRADNYPKMNPAPEGWFATFAAQDEDARPFCAQLPQWRATKLLK